MRGLSLISMYLWLYEGLQVAVYAIQGQPSLFVTHGFYMLLWSWILQKLFSRREFI